jgi:hypothetical protein
MFTCFFWHERHNVKFGSEIQYLEYFFICFAILNVFKNREGNYYQIIFLAFLRLLSFLVLFLNGSVIKTYGELVHNYAYYAYLNCVFERTDYQKRLSFA